MPRGIVLCVLAGLFSEVATGQRARAALLAAGFSGVDVDATEDGESLVTVDSHTDLDRARLILEELGAEIGDAEPIAADDAPSGERLSLRAERLRFQRRRDVAEAPRIRKEIVTEMVSIRVPVRHEDLVIEDPSGEVTRIPLSEERLSVVRETIAREEVRIGTRSVEEVVHIDAVVRHEALRVDDAPSGSTALHQDSDTSTVSMEEH